jgi:hypothetical protein
MLCDTWLNLIPRANICGASNMHIFSKISGLDFDFFLGVVVTLCGTNKHFSGGPNHELQEQ